MNLLVWKTGQKDKGYIGTPIKTPAPHPPLVFVGDLPVK